MSSLSESCPACGAKMISSENLKWSCLRCGYELKKIATPPAPTSQHSPNSIEKYANEVKQNQRYPISPPEDGQRANKNLKFVLALIVAAIIIVSLASYYSNYQASFDSPGGTQFPPIISITAKGNAAVNLTISSSSLSSLITTSSTSSTTTSQNTTTTPILDTTATSTSSTTTTSTTSKTTTTSTTSTTSPFLVLVPNSGPPKSHFTFSFKGGNPNAQYYEIAFSLENPIMTNSFGYYTGVIAVPSNAHPGVFSVLIKDSSGSVVTEATFTVGLHHSTINASSFLPAIFSILASLIPSLFFYKIRKIQRISQVKLPFWRRGFSDPHSYSLKIFFLPTFLYSFFLS